MFKCDAIMALNAGVELHVAAAVDGEFSKGGPAERSALKKLKVNVHPVTPGTREWQELCLIRSKFSTRDLGEDASLAVCLAEASRGHLFPFVTFDGGAAADAREHGVVTMGFLELLSWMVHLGSLTLDEGEKIEAQAQARDGWKRPANYSGSLLTVASQFREQTAQAVEAWKRRVSAAKKTRHRP